MQEHHNTPNTNAGRVRHPFGELHHDAMRRTVQPIDNSQREDFLKGKPSVYDTLRRHLESIIKAGTRQEEYDEVCHALYIGMLDLFPNRAHPTETLPEICAQDEAAEGLEDVAEIDAVASPTAGRLSSLYRRMAASMSTKRRALHVIHRDFRKAVAR